MQSPGTPNNEVHYYMDEISARVVATSKRPGDRYHIGKLIIQGLKDNPDFVLQVNGETGESETNRSVLNRSIRCAIALQKLGLRQGDVVSILSPNHLDACIPLYAALYSGFIASTLDRLCNSTELRATFNSTSPKAIFCQAEKLAEVREAINEMDFTPTIVIFNNLEDLLLSVDNQDVDNFQPADIDTENSIAFLIATSGTTGLPKSAQITHKNIAIAFPATWVYQRQFPKPTRSVLIWSPLQWMTVIQMYIMSPILQFTRVQSPATLTEEHCIQVINKFEPTFTLIGPTFWTTLINMKNCDLTCFRTIILGGSAVQKELITETKKRAPKARVLIGFGLSESSGMVFFGDVTNDGGWREMSHLQYRLVNIDTLNDVTEAHVTGELWIKGLVTCKGYFNNSEATNEVIVEDNWLRTGDIFYKDEYDNYYFVDRYKMLLKYRTHQISPLELENVIRQHPAVLDVGVTGIPDPEAGDLVVACVVVKPEHSINAQEVKNMVKNNLTDSKQLRGGVVFLKNLPLTSTAKVDRKKLKALVLTSDRE